MRNKKQKVINWVSLFLIIALLLGFLVFRIIKDNVSYDRFPDRGLPRINIDLSNTSLSEIKEQPKGDKYEGNSLQIYDDGKILEYDDVEIKGRGNLSWDQPKKSYQIQFSKGTNLFGLGKMKRWVLISNSLDKSHVRNDAASVFAEMLDMKMSQRGSFVEVYFNGEYEGLYYLMKKVEIAKNSVNLRKEGSVLFELDNLHNKGECYWTLYGNCLILKGYKSGENNSQKESVERFLMDFDELEKEAEEGVFDEIVKIADIDSLVDYYLVNEFVVDPDAYSSSFYWYRDGLDGKIFVGPIWDYDLAFGNRAWGWEQVESSFYLPVGSMARKDEAFGRNGLRENKDISKLFYYLMDIDEFRNAVQEKYTEKLSGRKSEYLAAVNNMVEKIRNAEEVDIAKWSQKSFQLYVDELLDRIGKRFDYFEQEYGLDNGNKMEMY